MYFDTDAFHHFAAAFKNRSLADKLRGKFVLSPITMLEVFTHIVEESICEQLQGLPNWMEKDDVHLLSWPEDAILDVVFGIPPTADPFLGTVQAVLNECLLGTPSNLYESAHVLRETVKDYKIQHANNFPALVELCRQNPEHVAGFDDGWLKCVVPSQTNRLSGETGCLIKAKLLEALSAYREFEFEKLSIALQNTNYNAQRHQNDVLDARQLAYLCDPALHFITCDSGFLAKVTKSVQRNRIHRTSPGEISDPVRAEALLERVLHANATNERNPIETNPQSG